MEAERLWISKASLIILGSTLAFFLIAPVLLGFPVTFQETERIIQIIVPVFIAYLSTGAAFLFAAHPTDKDELLVHPALMSLMVRGPIYLVSGGLVLATATFWYSNRHDGPPASGMSLDQYCWSISMLLGILALTTGVMVKNMFPARTKRRNR